MLVNSVYRFNPWRVNPISRTEGSPSRDDRTRHYTPKEEIRPSRRRIADLDSKETVTPSMVGVFLDVWA